MTSIAEAAYIRYFRPPYNLQLGESFPSTDLKLWRRCYELDFSAVVAEVNTEDLDGPLYSTCRPLRSHHIASFDLHSPEKRMSFFAPSIDRDGLMIDLQGSNELDQDGD